MKLDELRAQLSRLYQDLEVYLDQAEKNQVREHQLLEEEHRLRQMEEKLEEIQTQLNSWQNELEAEKQAVLRLKETTEETERGFRLREATLTKREEALAGKEAEVLKQAQETAIQAALLQKQIEADKTRKEILDIREAKINERLRQLKIVEEIEVA